MVLLHIMHSLAVEWRWNLTVAHVNHSLRGRSSDADERLVKRAATTLNIPAISARAEVRKYSSKAGVSLEMAARHLRHCFLARTARLKKLTHIALAHHADDQVELFFVRLFRGSGGEGLSGMSYVNPSPMDPKCQLVRPLLDFSKSQLADYAKRHHISYREDATNSSSAILRNRVRHELLPLLRKSYQAGIDQTVLRAMSILSAEQHLTDDLARAWLQKNTKPLGLRKNVSNLPFQELPIAIQRRSLQLQLLELDVPPDFFIIEYLRCSPDVPITFGGLKPFQAVSRDENGRVALNNNANRVPAFRRSHKRVHLQARHGHIRFGGLDFSWAIGPLNPDWRTPKPPGQEVFDADRVGSTIILRHWRAGDRFWPIGMPNAVKLQDLLTNAKIAREARRLLVVATTANGEIFWVQGLRISEHFKVQAATNRSLLWKWERA